MSWINPRGTLFFALLSCTACSVSGGYDKPTGLMDQQATSNYTPEDFYRDVTWDKCTYAVDCLTDSMSFDVCLEKAEAYGATPDGANQWSQNGRSCDPNTNDEEEAQACARASSEEMSLLLMVCDPNWTHSLSLHWLPECTDLCLPEAADYYT